VVVLQVAQAFSQPTWSALIPGLRVIRRDGVVWPLFCALMPFVLLVEGVNPAEIFLARDALGASPIQYALSDVFAATGAVVGSYLAGAFSVGNAAFGRLLMTRTRDANGKVQEALGGVARTFSLMALALGGLATTLLGPRRTFVLAGNAGMIVMRADRSGQSEDLRPGGGDDERVLELRAP